MRRAFDRAFRSYGIKHTSLGERKIQCEEEARKVLTDEKARFIGSELIITSHITGVTSTRLRPAGCCQVACPNCGATIGARCASDGLPPTASGYRSTRSGEPQP
jgi:hypothetical protein